MRVEPEGILSHAVPEIECLDAIEEIESEYARRFGASVVNVSHWDPSDEFHDAMLPHLELPSLSSAINYSFSYQLGNAKSILAKLGGNPARHAILITPSSTASIVCALNWLKAQNGRMVVLCPAYFSVFYVGRQFGIPVAEVSLIRRKGHFQLPKIIGSVWREPGAIWLTSPVYGTGVYLSREILAILHQLLESGWLVIADECLALPGEELVRTLGDHRNFIGVYSPHKSLCVNGVKFSALLFDQHHSIFFDQWADVWYGGLGCSTIAAIAHFLSPNFEEFRGTFLELIGRQSREIRLVCHAHNVQLDGAAQGHFVSCYLPWIPYELGMSVDFMAKLIQATGVSIISGNRSRLDPSSGFSFRVNLARKGRTFLPSFTRLIRYLASQSFHAA